MAIAPAFVRVAGAWLWVKHEIDISGISAV